MLNSKTIKAAVLPRAHNVKKKKTSVVFEKFKIGFAKLLVLF